MNERTEGDPLLARRKIQAACTDGSFVDGLPALDHRGLGGALVPVLGARTVLGAAGFGGTVLCVLIATLGAIRRMRLPPADTDVS